MRSFFGALLLSLVLAVAFGQGKGPCHENKRDQGTGVTCEKVIVPKDLCRKCMLKPFNPRNGHFINCKSIYNLDDPECRAVLREYANLNKDCDPVRKRQTARFSRADIFGLDYFVYSMCEECCDCVPFGTDPEKYHRAKEAKNLVVPDRGNCPAHAWYDICQVLPKIRYVINPGGTEPTALPPRICPILTTWIRSPDATSWLEKDMVRIPKEARKFLTRYLNVAKCKNRRVWERCARLEKAQRRLGF